jgi:CxxC motif-containing protein (DUF1111 family)
MFPMTPAEQHNLSVGNQLMNKCFSISPITNGQTKDGLKVWSNRNSQRSADLKTLLVCFVCR